MMRLVSFLFGLREVKQLVTEMENLLVSYVTFVV